VAVAAGRIGGAQTPPSAPAQPHLQDSKTQDSKAQVAPGPQAHSEQAYSLPPDKLAKARTLNKIRLTLGIAGALWSVAFLWWLLASRNASRLEHWTQRRAGRRWVQGLLFFAIFIIIDTLASLPLDMAGHLVSLNYGISV